MQIATPLKRVMAATLAGVLAGGIVAQSALACTGIMLTTTGGQTVNGRTLEFGMYIDTDIVMIPRGYAFTGETPSGEGMAWTAKYAAVGAIAFGNLALIDGINEKGLAVGSFYFPSYAGYSQTTPENQAQSMGPADFPNWLVTSFETVDEVRAALEKGTVKIAPTLIPGFPPVPQPLHYVVYDKSGKSLVIEPMNGELTLFDNPLGVITNSPTFDWHMTNLRNYVALNPLNVPQVEVNDMKLEQLGQGTGLLGLPGDFTPPSRFVRAAAFSAMAVRSKTSQEAALQVFHILNNFDIPVGAARAEEDGKTHFDYTMLTVARDPGTLRYFWKTYDDQTIRMVDMTTLDLDGTAVLKLSTEGRQPIVDMSSDLK
ncbi:linear amide C-N hydrolase [Acuticoccus sp. I52.16.1]|uniref:linear amide C-N hydrolase n=1 Tax=Acuticoccus sp. I52.16.1 TaxID=2928472 RepID=UPI001FD3878F|nr:choloylglycine hydrolase family protein [Acuticoccus sp. I52.16.1]UOM34680.1 choloylglycine hydrolase family protein [Acuticoccus sp. I52.16.1]